jgi:hypothetical protein
VRIVHVKVSVSAKIARRRVQDHAEVAFREWRLVFHHIGFGSGLFRV